MLLYLLLYSFYLSQLPHLSYFIYLIFYLSYLFIYLFVYLFEGDDVVTTTADSEGTSCSWPNLEFEFTLSSGSLSYTTLQCTLFYRARLNGDFKIGHIIFPLSSLSIAPMISEMGIFECTSNLNSSSNFNCGDRSPSKNTNSGGKGRIVPKKVLDAVKRIEVEGRAGPRVTLNAMIKGNDYV